MNISISLRFNKGFEWYKADKVFVKGYAYYNNHLYKGIEFCNYFIDMTYNQIIDFILKANGSFALIINSTDFLIASVDRLRSIPLFYSKVKSEIVISDSAEFLLTNQNSLDIDDVNVSSFLRTGYTLGSDTLISSIKQIEAGNYLLINDAHFQQFKYYKHYSISNVKEKHEYFNELSNISENIFNRLIEYANGRTIVVPLSGGYDSRYIATMLKKLKYDRVICYTYGKKNSFEVETSRFVSNKLGYRWYYTEYDTISWQTYYNDKDYLSFASNLSSLPHFQDYLAIKNIKDNKYIPSESIFAPGFCGDFLGGSYIPKFITTESFSKNENETYDIRDYILNQHFNLENRITRENLGKLKLRISELIIDSNANNIDDFIAANQDFVTRHKLAKFVINSLRVYEHFGYKWALPLYDNELTEYWYSVPNIHKINNSLYNEYLMNFVFKEFELNLPKKIVNKPKLLYPVYNLLNKNLKKYLRPLLVKTSFIQDVNNFYAFLKIISGELRKEGYDYRITTKPNKVYAMWFIMKFNHQIGLLKKYKK